MRREIVMYEGRIGERRPRTVQVVTPEIHRLKRFAEGETEFNRPATKEEVDRLQVAWGLKSASKTKTVEMPEVATVTDRQPFGVKVSRILVPVRDHVPLTSGDKKRIKLMLRERYKDVDGHRQWRCTDFDIRYYLKIPEIPPEHELTEQEMNIWYKAKMKPVLNDLEWLLKTYESIRGVPYLGNIPNYVSMSKKDALYYKRVHAWSHGKKLQRKAV